jgi:hypothetical protein
MQGKAKGITKGVMHKTGQVLTDCCPSRFIKAGNIELRGAKYENRKSRAFVRKAKKSPSPLAIGVLFFDKVLIEWFMSTRIF